MNGINRADTCPLGTAQQIEAYIEHIREFQRIGVLPEHGAYGTIVWPRTMYIIANDPPQQPKDYAEEKAAA